MEEVSLSAASGGLVRDTLKGGNGNVPDENLCMPIRLAADVLRDISYSQVDRICLLAPK